MCVYDLYYTPAFVISPHLILFPHTAPTSFLRFGVQDFGVYLCPANLEEASGDKVASGGRGRDGGEAGMPPTDAAHRPPRWWWIFGWAVEVVGASCSNTIVLAVVRRQSQQATVAAGEHGYTW
jgi:hypothetical protein